MERKYPKNLFLFFVISDFICHFFYLFVPGVILCIVGIWARTCLWIGLGILGIDIILSVIDQLNIRRVSLTESDNPRFNELMDAFYGPGGKMEDLKSIIDARINEADPFEQDEE